MANVIEQLDAQVGALLADWSILTTVLAVSILTFILYPLIVISEPDTHPLLLARQASASNIRYKSESATYRSPEIPHGLPLRTGLNVKEPGAPRWATGKDGDLRDIWREVQRGGTTLPDGKAVPKGTITTILGKEEKVEHDVEELSKEIGIIGKQLSTLNVRRVAIYLPNGIEYLQTIFASSFFGTTPILLPYNLPLPKVYELIKATQAEGLVCSAGSLPLEDVAKECTQLQSLIWVVERSSRQMDWSGVPEGAEGRLTVCVWHDLVADKQADASAELPSSDTGSPPPGLITVWLADTTTFATEIVEFTQGNLVSATAALMSCIPLRQRLVPSDLVLPADSFAHSFALCQTFASLVTHCSLALSSVAGPGIELASAARGVSPTVIIASAGSLRKLHDQALKAGSSMLQRLGKYLQTQTLASGRMPSGSTAFGIANPLSLANQLGGRLRLILAAERHGESIPVLNSGILADLRIYTGARITYALSAAPVAGAIAQSNVFDYRNAGPAAHFGVPVSSVEVKMVSANEADVSGSEARGELVISGPAVSGDGVARLTKKFRMRDDFTIAYA